MRTDQHAEETCEVNLTGHKRLQTLKIVPELCQSVNKTSRQFGVCRHNHYKDIGQIVVSKSENWTTTTVGESAGQSKDDAGTYSTNNEPEKIVRTNHTLARSRKQA